LAGITDRTSRPTNQVIFVVINIRKIAGKRCAGLVRAELA